MRLGVIDDVLDRMERRIRRHHQHILAGRHQNDRREIFDRIEFAAWRDGHVRRDELAAEADRVAVRRGLRRRRGADIAAGAGTIFDENRLAPRVESLSVRMRPSVSMLPPGGNGMIRRTA